jgi:copper chaperone
MMQKATIDISGMSCDHCVVAVRGALETLSGVRVESVTVGAASVQYEPATVTPSQIADAIRAEGYEPRNL